MHDAAAVLVARNDQRYTAHRRRLVETLAGARRPLSVQELVGSGLPQSSAYRNLAVLQEAGVVHRVDSGDLSRYELAEELSEHHHHLICSSCGEVEDFTLPAAVEEQVESAAARVARKVGFALRHHRLDLVGTCPRCRG